MRKKRLLTGFIGLMLCTAMLLSACGTATETAVATSETSTEAGPSRQGSMLEEAEILYEKEEMVPSIMVDQVGYMTGATKQAILKGSVLPDSFLVVDNATGQTVLSGEVEEMEDWDTEDALYGLADFSSLDEEGSYHLEAELLGVSMDFSISPAIYDDLVAAAVHGLEACKSGDRTEEKVPMESDPSRTLEVSGGFVTSADGQRSAEDGCIAALDLWKVYDYYRESLADVDLTAYIRYEIEWLNKLQNPETGGVYSSVSFKSDGSGSLVVIGETTRATAYYAALMAKSSYEFAKTDEKFSKECLQHANLAWSCLEANKDIVSAAQMFRAAVEIYRATGGSDQKKVIDDYLSKHADEDYTDRISLDGAMSYMATSRSVDVTYCTTLMQHFMTKTEAIAGASKNARMFVDLSVTDESEMLRNLAELVEADYILTSREYSDIECNYLHYFAGRNETGSIHEDLSYSPDAYAEFLLLMGRLKTETKIEMS